MFRLRWYCALVPAFLVFAAGEAFADPTLVGTQLRFEVASPKTTPLFMTDFTVSGTPVAVPNLNKVVPFNLVVDNTSATLTYTSAAQFATASFNGYIFEELTAGAPAFTSISIDPATTLAGFGSSNIEFDNTDLYLNVSGLGTSVGTVLKVDFTSVPEPSALSLVLVSTFAALKRRNRRS